MSDDIKITYYSLLSGDIYTISPDEVDNLDEFQVPLHKAPSDKCKHCFGRGYMGYDRAKQYYPMCKCVFKLIDREKVQDIGIKY